MSLSESGQDITQGDRKLEKPGVTEGGTVVQFHLCYEEVKLSLSVSNLQEGCSKNLQSDLSKPDCRVTASVKTCDISHFHVVYSLQIWCLKALNPFKKDFAATTNNEKPDKDADQAGHSDIRNFFPLLCFIQGIVSALFKTISLLFGRE